MKNAQKRILVVDDHPLIRSGLCEAINAESELLVCGEAESCKAAYEAILRLQPDLMVLDLNLIDGNGWNFLEQLRSENHLPPTLVLSVCDEKLYAPRLLRSGAQGYLMKDEPVSIVINAIRKILNGYVAVSENIASALIMNATTSGATVSTACGMDQLSNRELQVCELLKQGMNNKTIADRLGISQKTIGTYKARLMEKLGVRTTHELIEKT